MTKKQVTFYEKLVYTAYGFYMLLGGVWVVLNLFWGHYFNYQAFLIVIVFAAQAYYKHRLTNLLLGVPLLGLSIYSALEFLLLAGKTGFDAFAGTLIALSVLSMIMSGILIFGYMKLSFMEQK